MKNTLNNLLITIGLTLLITPFAQADAMQGNTETTGQYVYSSTITAKVKTALVAKKELDSTKIKVQSETAPKGKVIVILTGTQKSSDLVNLAGLTAVEVDGVAKVINKLTVAE